jgi:hypothetical protein
VSCPLSDSVSCAALSGLGRCRVGSGSRTVSDGRLGFRGFLDRDLLVPWLLSHQWIVCDLSADPRWCWWVQLSLPRSSFFRCCPHSRGDAGKLDVVGTSYSPRTTTGDIEHRFTGARRPPHIAVFKVPQNYRVRPRSWKIEARLEGTVAGQKWTLVR